MKKCCAYLICSSVITLNILSSEIKLHADITCVLGISLVDDQVDAGSSQASSAQSESQHKLSQLQPQRSKVCVSLSMQGGGQAHFKTCGGQSTCISQ